MSREGRLPRGGGQASAPVLATITGETGGGVYTWDRFAGEGPASGSATELNLSTGIANNTNVVLHYAGGTYYFFFPVEECS